MRFVEEYKLLWEHENGDVEEYDFKNSKELGDWIKGIDFCEPPKRIVIEPKINCY